jgi:hypothetical protein
MDYQQFLGALTEAATGVLKDSKVRGKAALKEIQDFIAEMEPAAERAFETAVRTGEKTHWNTVKLTASRVLLRTIAVSDTLAADTRDSIRNAVFAAIRTAAALSVVVL